MHERDYLTKKLIYQSKNRGCKETDILLGKFADQFLHEMSIEDLHNYETILQQNDADIVDWITHKAPVPDIVNNDAMKKLLSYHNTL